MRYVIRRLLSGSSWPRDFVPLSPCVSLKVKNFPHFLPQKASNVGQPQLSVYVKSKGNFFFNVKHAFGSKYLLSPMQSNASPYKETRRNPKTRDTSYFKRPSREFSHYRQLEQLIFPKLLENFHLLADEIHTLLKIAIHPDLS